MADNRIPASRNAFRAADPGPIDVRAAKKSPSQASAAEILSSLKTLTLDKLDRLAKKVAGAEVLLGLRMAEHFGDVKAVIPETDLPDCVLLLCKHNEVQSLKALFKYTRPDKLDLSGKSLKKPRLENLGEALKGNADVTCLKLSACTIEKTGAMSIAKAIETMPALVELDLSDNAVGRGGAAALSVAAKKCARLKRLNLSGCDLKDGCAADVAGVLHRNATLLELDVSKNRFKLDGAGCFGAKLSCNSTLTCLNLDRNKLRPQDAVRFVRDYVQDRNFTLQSIGADNHAILRSDEEMLSVLGGNRSPGLAQFRFHPRALEKFEDLDDVVAALPDRKLCRALLELTQSGTPPPDQRCFDFCAHVLSCFPDTRKHLALLLQHSRFIRLGPHVHGRGKWEEEYLRNLCFALKKNTRIVYLNLSGNAISSVAPLGKALARNTRLRILDLTDCGLTDEAMERLAAALQENHTLLSISGGTIESAFLPRSLSSTPNALERLVQRNRNRFRNKVQAGISAFLGSAHGAPDYLFNDPARIVVEHLDLDTVARLHLVSKPVAVASGFSGGNR